MFKKHKQLITGFILGALLFGTMPVQAKVQEYLLQKSTAKVMVDGKEFANKELPVLNYKNSNYIPMATFREICNTIGIGFEWVGESREVQISTGKNVVEQPVKETIQPIEEKKGGTMTKIEKDGYDLVVFDGLEYIPLRELSQKHKGYDFHWHEETEIFDLIYNPHKLNSPKHLEIIQKDIQLEYRILNGKTYMLYNDFKENILHLIKE